MALLGERCRDAVIATVWVPNKKKKKVIKEARYYGTGTVDPHRSYRWQYPQ